MLALLGVPLVVITVLPRFFELAGSVPALPGSAGPLPTPAFRLSDPTPTNVRQRFAPVIEPPPPTLSPPEAPAAPQATPRPSPTGERVVIGNTGGGGAVLRSAPLSGPPASSLCDGRLLRLFHPR